MAIVMWDSLGGEGGVRLCWDFYFKLLEGFKGG